MMKRLLTMLVMTGALNLCYGQTFHVGETTRLFQDSSRNRPVKTEIWYPTNELDTNHTRMTDLPYILQPTIRNAKITGGKHPLILLSHGTGGGRFSLAWLAIDLAKKGYIVAAPDHWGNTYDNRIPVYFVRYYERPLDISFVLTKLLDDPEFKPNIDANKVGAAGFSFGGYTVIALAGGEVNFHYLLKHAQTKEGKKDFNVPEIGDLSKILLQDSTNTGYTKYVHLKDARIKAFVAMCPGLGFGFTDSTEVEKITAPIFIIDTEGDHITPIQRNAGVYHRLIKTSTLWEIKGKAGHYAFLPVGNKTLQKEAKQQFTDAPSVDREQLHREVEKSVSAFFDKNLTGLPLFHRPPSGLNNH